MPDIGCTCVIESYIDPPMSVWTLLLDFLFSLLIGALGVIVNYKLHFQHHQPTSHQVLYSAIQYNQISQLWCSINIHLFILLPAVISPSSFTSQSGFNPILRNNRRQRGERRFSYFDLQLTTSSPVFSGD